MNPFFWAQYVARQIFQMMALHDHDDHAFALVVQARIKRAIVPVVHRRTPCFRQSVLGLQRVIDDQYVAAAPGERASNRRRASITLMAGDNIHLGVFAYLGAWENTPVPIRLHHSAAVLSMLAREIRRIARADDAFRR